MRKARAMRRIVSSVLVALCAGAVFASEKAGELRVQVTETAAVVQLRILAPEDVAPGSVEVEIAGRTVAVVAKRTDGRALRSAPVHLAEPAVEVGAGAEYEDDGSVTVTLRKARRRAGP
ncbi:MAG TPA: hypothetical protein VKA21_01790, partial [Candidatus Binatia bacterium]|nr:hypothetical protein [Candidatus Binatia bacterium]